MSLNNRMQKAYVEWKENSNARVFTWTVSVATAYVGVLPSRSIPCGIALKKMTWGEREGRREVLKPWSKILQ